MRAVWWLALLSSPTPVGPAPSAPAPVVAALTPVPLVAAVAAPERAVVIRLSDDAAWAPAVPTDLDLVAALTPPEDAWPDEPAADALWVALADGDDGEAFVDVARAEGYLDRPPSEFDDPWERTLALWASYALEGPTESFALELAEVWALTPDGDLAHPLSAAVMMVSDDMALVREAALDLLDADDPTLRAAARAWLAEQPDTTLDELTGGRADDPASLSVLLGWAMAHQHPGAGALAAALGHHPAATAAQQHDGDVALALLAPPPEGAWLAPLRDQVRGCAGVAPGERFVVVVRDGAWRVDGDGAAAACLDGWSTRAPDLTLRVRVTR
jgi:hypothetical protein